jgi:hypothetical protein
MDELEALGGCTKGERAPLHQFFLFLKFLMKGGANPPGGELVEEGVESRGCEMGRKRLGCGRLR